MKNLGVVIKYNLGVLVLASLLSCSVQKTEDQIKYPKEEYSVVYSIKNAYYSSVAVLNENERVIGSGVILKHKQGCPIQIITNYHVVDAINSPTFFVQTVAKDIKREVEVIYFDAKKDLALLQGTEKEDESGPQILLSSNNPERGESIWIIGSPTGRPGNITKGILSNIFQGQEEKEGVEYYRTDTAIFFGNSGGGVFNDTGSLIGVAVGLEMIDNGPMPPVIIPGGGVVISLKTIKLFLVESLG